MASRSRAAQEKLTELEKESAPFEDQLVEASRFIGVDLGVVGRRGKELSGPEYLDAKHQVHGREEWVLRWLLKKLQSPKDGIPRKTPASWHLLCHVIQTVPLPNIARTLNERKFMTILRQTLEEAQTAVDAGTKRILENASDSSSTIQGEETKVSKKRKRSGELVIHKKESTNDEAQRLLESILAVVDCMVQFTVSETFDEGQTAAFATEYMRSVIRTSAEESAQIFGAWLSLSSAVLKVANDLESPEWRSWLSPFIKVWKSHAAGSEDTIQFSLHCTRPLLSLLRLAKKVHPAAVIWINELEQLLARNVIIPARTGNNTTSVKSSSRHDADLDILRTLTRVPILLDSANAPLLFDVAIRSLQPHEARRRRSQDEAWLRHVFNTLVEPFPSERSQSQTDALCAMLQSAIDHRVELELSILRSMASTLSFSGHTEHEDWSLLTTIIHLDANVFLIPNEEKDLMQMILTQITTASVKVNWPAVREQIINGVLIPLMNEFAKARDLTGFIKHWYKQLVELEKTRAGEELDVFSAWEEDALQFELIKLFEASLTLQQITHMLDWLKSEVQENPAAVAVILEAIAGSITQEEVVDAIGLRLYQIMFGDANSFETIDKRYRWRSWRIITRTLQWTNSTSVHELGALLTDRGLPFSILIENGTTDAGVLFIKKTKDKKHQTSGPRELEALEQFRCACAIWDVAEGNGELTIAFKPVMLGFLRKFRQDLNSFTKAHLKAITKDNHQDLVRTAYGESLNTLSRDLGWLNWSCAQCAITEYPRAFQLYIELSEDNLQEILQNLFWLATSNTAEDESKAFGFLNLWNSFFCDDYILNNPKIIRALIAVTLDEKIVEKQSSSSKYSLFAAKSLLQMPLELLSRKERENIMTKWLPTDASRSIGRITLVGSDPAFLALLVKTMQRSPVYENMKFQDLVDMAEAVADSPKPRVALGLFHEITRLTLSHLVLSAEQGQNPTYIQDAFKYVQTSLHEDGVWVTKWKSTNKDYSAIKLAEVVIGGLSANSKLLDDSNIISSKEFAKTTKALRKVLLSRLKKQLRNTSDFKDDEDDGAIELLCTIEAMATVGVDSMKLAKLSSDASSRADSLKQTGLDIGKRLEAFMAAHSSNSVHEAFDGKIEGDTSSLFGREAIRDRIAALTNDVNQKERLKLLQGLIGYDWAGLKQLDKLLAMRHVITTCEDSRPVVDDKDEEVDAQPFNLSTAYSALCSQLYKTISVRQFCLISETLEMMLRTKGRTLSQWNIDSTLGSIAILCSRSAPKLSPKSPGTIYLHLCTLFRAVLTSHRLKLQGHFHLVVQVMQALLRLLFSPHSHTNQTFLKARPPPSWLPQTTSSANPLNGTHAASFTRLLTLICDPTTSSVTRSTKHNALTSATHSAKKIAGQHMHFLLTFYVKLQLEMRMAPEVREKMIPGIYAVFDTTSPEMRRMMSDGLDSSGRAVFTGLFRDWQRFGQWKGS